MNDGLLGNDALISAFQNIFTVENGSITSVSFYGQTDFGSNTLDSFGLGGTSYITFCCGTVETPFLSLDNSGTLIAGGALRFYRIVDVPEPGTLALLGLGLGLGLGPVGMGMRRRIKAS